MLLWATRQRVNTDTVAAQKEPLAPSSPAPARAANRVGKRFVGGYLPLETWKKIQHLRTERDTTIQELTEEAFGDLLAKYHR